MYSKTKALGQQSLIYGLGGVLNQLVGFFLIPVYSRYLVPAEFGVLELLLRTGQLSLIVGHLGLASAVFKAALYDKYSDTRKIYSTAFYTLIASGLFVTFSGCLLSGLLSDSLYGTREYSLLIKLVFFTVFLDCLSVVALARLRIEGRALRFSIISFAAFTLRMLLNIFFIVYLKMGVVGVIGANAIQSLLFAFVYVGHIRDKIGLCFSRKILRSLLAFSLPTVPALMASSALVVSDRYILGYFRPQSEVGVYAMGYRISMIAGLVVSSFQMAWPTMLFTAAKEKDSTEFYSRVLTYIVFVGFSVGLGLSVFSKDILRLLSTPDYYEAHEVIPLLALSYVFYGAYFATNIGALLQNKTYYVTVMVGISLIVQVGLNFFLIPEIGIMGAALSTAISYFLLPVMAILISKRYYPVPYEYGRLLLIGMVAVALYCVSYSMSIENIWFSIVLHGVVVCLFPFLLWMIGFFRPEEKNKILALAGNGRSRIRQLFKKRCNGELKE